MTHRHRGPIVVEAFAAPFARYPGYVISATRSRDQHVIVIVLTRPASTNSRLVRKLAHAQHHAAPPKRRQHNVKNVTGRKIGVDRPWATTACIFYFQRSDNAPHPSKIAANVTYNSNVSMGPVGYSYEPVTMHRYCLRIDLHRHTHRND